MTKYPKKNNPNAPFANESADILNTLGVEKTNPLFRLIVIHAWIKGAEKANSKKQAEIEALKLRELSDEEIISEWIGNDRNYYNFARAILRKAQEK